MKLDITTEYNPAECRRGKHKGSENVTYVSPECGEKAVVALSADKAYAPI